MLLKFDTIQQPFEWKCLFWFDSFCPDQQLFSHVGMGLPGLNQYLAADKVSCSRTQHSNSTSSEVGTTVEPFLSGHSKRRPKFDFKINYRLMQVKSFTEESILQYFRPSLSFHLSLRLLFCLFLSDRFRQVLL